MSFTTKEISRFGFQANMLAAKISEVNDNQVECLLSTGKRVMIEAPNLKYAHDVLYTLLYYPITNEHAGHEFSFEVTISFE